MVRYQKRVHKAKSDIGSVILKWGWLSYVGIKNIGFLFWGNQYVSTIKNAFRRIYNKNLSAHKG